jgi:HEAT repeat protein
MGSLNEADVLNMEDKGDIRGLLKALKDKKDVVVRRKAAASLGRVGGIRAVDPLIDALKDDDYAVRAEAQDALVALGDHSREGLIHKLKDKNEEVRQGAVATLAKMGNARLAGIMLETARDKDAPKSARDVMALAGSLFLQEALQEKSSGERQQAAEALGRMGWEPTSAEERSDYMLLMEGQGTLPTEAQVIVEEVLGPAPQVEAEPPRSESPGAFEAIVGSAGEPVVATTPEEQETSTRDVVGEAPHEAPPEISEPTPVAALEESSLQLGEVEASSSPDTKEKVRAEAAPPAAPAEVQIPKEEPQAQGPALEEPAPAITPAAVQEVAETFAGGTEPPTEVEERTPAAAQTVAEEYTQPTTTIDASRLEDDTVATLLADLRSGESDVRERAAEALEEMGWEPADDEELVQYLLAGRGWQQLVSLGESAVDTLGRILGEGDDYLKAGAAWALGGIGGAVAADHLARAISTEAGWARRYIIVALGETRDASKKDVLVKALADEEGLVRRKAAEALAKIGTEAVEPILHVAKDKPSYIRHDAAFALAMMGGPGVEAVVKALKSDDRLIQLIAAEVLEAQGWQPGNESERIDYLIVTWQWDTLSRLGSSAVAALIQMLGDGDEYARCGSAWALGTIGDITAVARLIEATKDEHGWVRRDAAWALGQIKDLASVEPLVTLLRDTDEWVRVEAAQSLMQIGQPARDHLLQMVKEEDPRVQRIATDILREIGEMPAPQPIPETPQTESGTVVQEMPSETPIEEQAPEIVEPSPAASEEAGSLIAAREWDRLVELGMASAAALIEALKDQDGDVREKAAETLAKIGEPAIDALIEALLDEDSNVRRGAAWTLGEIKNKKAVEPLIATLHDEYDSVRQNSAWALGEIKDPQAVEALIDALTDEYVNVRQYAAWSLGELHLPVALEPLLSALQDRDGSVRQYAAAALGELKEEGAVDPLLEALKDRVSDVRGQVAWALAQIKDPRAVDPLLEALDDEDRYVRRDVVEALGAIRDSRAVEPLVQMLKDGDKWVQTLAASSLGSIGDDAAVEPLVEALRSPHGDVAQAAEDALARLVRGKHRG